MTRSTYRSHRISSIRHVSSTLRVCAPGTEAKTSPGILPKGKIPGDVCCRMREYSGLILQFFHECFDRFLVFLFSVDIDYGVVHALKEHIFVVGVELINGVILAAAR